MLKDHAACKITEHAGFDGLESRARGAKSREVFVESKMCSLFMWTKKWHSAALLSRTAYHVAMRIRAMQGVQWISSNETYPSRQYHVGK